METVLCVFLLHGLLVTAFPANDGMDPGILMPVSGVAEFSGTSPATGTVAILGLAPYPDILPPSTQNVILGANLAEAIITEAGKDIDAKLAEIDAFVENELKTMAPQLENAMENAIKSENRLNSTLLGMESEISNELTKFDEFIEAELAKTEELVQSVIRNVNTETESLNNKIGHTVTKKLSEQEALIELVMLILQSFVESKLAQTEAVVKSELEKVNTFVETELEKVETIVESETAKIDSSVDTELQKTDALVQAEVTDMESFIEPKLKKSESLMKTKLENVNAFVQSQLDRTNELVNSELSKLEACVETELDRIEKAVGEIDCAGYSNAIPVTGDTLITGHTGCPPIHPTAEPLPIYLESYPVIETLDYAEPYPMLPTMNTDFLPPKVGVAKPFIPLHQSPCSYVGSNMNNEPVLYHRKQLPFVNIIGGTVRASGRIKLFADFPCPPLTATEVGPDGKKYIWISKKFANKESKTAKVEGLSSKEDSSSEESSSSEEKSSSEENSNDAVDFGLLGPIPVRGDAKFQGTTPAYGSVTITGHSHI